MTNREGVVLTDPDIGDPDVIQIPDEDDDFDPVVLVDDDEDEAKYLMGVLHIDGMPD